MAKEPLISVVILTYNSSSYVVSTLESIKRQSYEGDIELIIGDDCSADDTIAICEEWVNRNDSRFIRCIIKRSEKNVGVVSNLNSCYEECQGEWIKVIAGDDILMDDALDSLYQTAVLQQVPFVYSALRTFSHDAEIKTPEQQPYVPGGPCDKLVDLNYMYRKPNFWVNAPTFFIATRLVKEIGGVPVIFRNIEDRPLFAKIIASGHQVYHSAKATVFYRIHEKSISATIDHGRYAECNWITFRKLLYPNYPFCRAVDMSLRMLPLWMLSKTRSKNTVYRLFRFATQLLWLVWRSCTFFITR